MAKSKLGNLEEARGSLREAEASLEMRFEAVKKDFGGNWHQWLTAAILLREAREVVGVGE
jgi:hypothetical protein